jgi:cbb3-type cytochrome oxidase maturation protein
LELLIVIIGIALVLGGIAMMLFGRRWWRHRPRGWDEPRRAQVPIRRII